MKNTNPTIIFLRECFSWMGNHSGYDLLYKYVKKVWQGQALNVMASRKSTFLKRRTNFFLSGCSSRINRFPYYDSNSMLAELNVLLQLFLRPCQVVHVMYLEMDYGILGHFQKRFLAKYIGTAHQPPGWWRMRHRDPSRVASLDALIVLSSEQKEFFEKFLPGRVHLIQHGVDTEFFKPASAVDNNHSQDIPHCVFCGHWLRDIPTLGIIIEKVLKCNNRIVFDIIVPQHKVDTPDFYRIARHDQVRWHSDLADSRLKEIYQRGFLLFLPLIDSTANNALLEATACGLPVVTTDVGGVRDYTSPSFAEYYDLKDVEGMASAILNLVDSKAELQRRRSAARKYAEEHLSWEKVFPKVIKLYNDLP
jgi:glycosyltransferase involved in cell wall biosynthesis